MTRALRLAVPNKGRLEEPAAALLHDAGLVYEKTDRTLTVPVTNVDLELLFVRAEDVPEMVADRVADLGITGYDLLVDSGIDLAPLVDLGFGRCRLAAAVPNGSTIDKPGDLAGLRVATSHLDVTRRFFADRGVAVTVVPLRGSVEVAPRLGLADAIVDLVSSGSTLLINGLRPVFTLLESQAVLVANPRTSVDRSADVERVATMLRSVVAGRRKRYLLMNVPQPALEAVESLIPGIDSPTVIPLAAPGMVAVHSVVDADEVWRLLPELQAAGASGILVLQVEQLLP